MPKPRILSDVGITTIVIYYLWRRFVQLCLEVHELDVHALDWPVQLVQEQLSAEIAPCSEIMLDPVHNSFHGLKSMPLVLIHLKEDLCDLIIRTWYK